MASQKLSALPSVTTVPSGAYLYVADGSASKKVTFANFASSLVIPLSTGVSGTLPVANGGTGQITAALAINALLPSQTSHAGKFLTTDGTTPSWGTSVTTMTFNGALSSDGAYSGITMTAESGYSQAFGDLVCMDVDDSQWNQADANAAYTFNGDSRGMLGIVVVPAVEGATCTVLLHGTVRADAKFDTFTVNAPLYVSETAGAITQTQPVTTDAVIRVIGTALTANSVYFNPDASYITHT